MNYETITNMDGETVIVKTDKEGIVSMFFADENNSDYQAYLFHLENEGIQNG
jgi:hypothetical protein